MLPLSIEYFFFFFFSSRKRHTTFSRDWSSDVCSSDLHAAHAPGTKSNVLQRRHLRKKIELLENHAGFLPDQAHLRAAGLDADAIDRKSVVEGKRGHVCVWCVKIAVTGVRARECTRWHA